MPDLPMQELLTWAAINSRDPQHTPDWDAEERFPRFREYAKKIRLGSSIRVPLITPHRPLGVFGIIRDTVNPFSEEEISFLGLIGRVVAFALDDGLNLRRAQHQNDQLQLLLNLTNRITSNLELRDLLRAVAANIREVIHAEVSPSRCKMQPRRNSGYSPSISRMEKGSSRKRCSLGQVQLSRKP